ncbi:hypothetical protein niasHT_033867 [Heterodera trifolii]|uniref:Ubiquitin-like domain-containing protein n=1 Tax=Heterodera trifolii TaxID=157864 RepID=A0ABD2IGI0_9BILA
MNRFGFGISAGLTMIMLMMMSQCIADDKFKIKVQGDKNTTVSVNVTDKVSELKEKIVEQLKQNMNKEIKILEAKLEKNKSKINKLMEKLINVKNTQTLEAKLGEKNNEKNNIVPERITLRLQKNGPPLEDGKTMKKCGIVNGTIQKIVYLTWDELEIKMEGDKNMIIYVKDTDTVLKVKELIAEKLNDEGQKNDEETKILPERLTLRHCKNGSVFEDQKTMKECEIGKDSVLFLTLDEFKISSVCEIDDFSWISGPTVMVKEEDTMADVKRKIAEEIKIDPKRQKLRNKIEPKRQMLRLNDYLGPKLEDSKTMKDYSIEKDQIISITFDEYKIFVHFNDKNYPIWVRKSDHVEILEVKAKRMLKMELDLDLADIKLKSRQSPGAYNMFDQKCHTMEQYEIKENDVIYVYREYYYKTLVEFEIFVEYKQKKYPVRVKGADTVRDLKTKIGNIQEIGILPNQQKKLICQAEDGEELVDFEKIVCYKIVKDSTVFLTFAEVEEQEKRSSTNFASPQLKNR